MINNLTIPTIQLRFLYQKLRHMYQFWVFKSKKELNYDSFGDLKKLGAARLVLLDLLIYRISFFLLDRTPQANLQLWCTSRTCVHSIGVIGSYCLSYGGGCLNMNVSFLCQILRLFARMFSSVVFQKFERLTFNTILAKNRNEVNGFIEGRHGYTFTRQMVLFFKFYG